MRPDRNRKVLLVGWDAADWDWLRPLMREGLMPNLTRLVEQGASGRLRTLDPMLSPTLWTSIATGRRPYEHGITSFWEMSPSGQHIQPVLGSGRTAKAVWNMFTQVGLKSNVVAWWPSHPAEPIDGVMVSNFYQRVGGTRDAPDPMPRGTVHPTSLTNVMAQLRLHHHELTGNHLLPFVPELARVDPVLDKRLGTLATITADAANVHHAATYLLEHEPADFTAVYYDALDHYAHAFMQYHPPLRPHVDRKLFELYRNVMTAACRYHDLMLGRLLELAGPETTVVLVSDHGFYADERRPVKETSEPLGPQYEHSPHGIIVAAGPGIPAGVEMRGAGLLDIAPTLLALFGLPAARDMPGKVLADLVPEASVPARIASWEHIPGNDGRHTSPPQEDFFPHKAAIDQLIDLGYVDPPSEDTAESAADLARERDYVTARSLMSAGEYARAIELLTPLAEDERYGIHYALYLTTAYLQAGRTREARETYDRMRARVTALTPELELLEAGICVAEGRTGRALSLLEQLRSERAELPQFDLRLAMMYLELHRPEDAEAAARDELTRDPGSAEAQRVLGDALKRQLKYEDAVGAYLAAVDLDFDLAYAHLGLGESLRELERYEESAVAFENALRIAPGANVVRQLLVELYERRLDRPELAETHRLAMDGRIEGEIIVVSGLPRAGTSLVMQMLRAGGIEVFVDDHRPADESNPRGYLEHEAVRRLDREKTFLGEAVGKAVKVVTQLALALPLNYRYRIVHVERDLGEVIASQARMLARENPRRHADTAPLHLAESYRVTTDKLLQKAEDLPQWELLRVQHADLIANPFGEAIRINDFLGGQLDVPAMARVVDASLYRERRAPSATASD